MCDCGGCGCCGGSCGCCCACSAACACNAICSACDCTCTDTPAQQQAAQNAREAEIGAGPGEVSQTGDTGVSETTDTSSPEAVTNLDPSLGDLSTALLGRGDLPGMAGYGGPVDNTGIAGLGVPGSPGLDAAPGSTSYLGAPGAPSGLDPTFADVNRGLPGTNSFADNPATGVDMQSMLSALSNAYGARPGGIPATDPFANLQTARTDPLSATPYPGSPPAISPLTDQDIQRVLQMGGQTAPTYDPSRDIVPGAFTAPGTVTAQNLAPLSTPVGNVPTPLGRPDISATIPTAPAPGPAPVSGTRPGAFTPGAGPGAGAPAPAAAPAPTPGAGPTDATARGGGVPLPSLAQLAALLGPGPGR